MLLGIGYVVIYVFPQFSSEKTEHFLGITSPIVLISIGLYMLYNIKNNKHVCSPSCSHHHQNNHMEAAKKNFNELKLSADKSIKPTHTQKTTALIGVLIPCPSAIAAFFMAGHSGNFQNSFGYVLIYVSGFVIVMFTLAILFSFIGKKLTKKQEKYPIFSKMDLISACLIIFVGFAYLINNLFFHHN